MTERDRVAADYAVLGVSTGPHLVSLLRPSLDALGCIPLARVGELADGSRITVAGLVIARQAPVSAKGFRFFTLADEGAHLDLVFRPEVARRTRAVANAHPLLMVEGTLEVSAGRRNLLVAAVTALDGEGRPLRASDHSGDPPAWPPDIPRLPLTQLQRRPPLPALSQRSERCFTRVTQWPHCSDGVGPRFRPSVAWQHVPPAPRGGRTVVSQQICPSCATANSTFASVCRSCSAPLEPRSLPSDTSGGFAIYGADGQAAVQAAPASARPTDYAPAPPRRPAATATGPPRS